MRQGLSVLLMALCVTPPPKDRHYSPGAPKVPRLPFGIDLSARQVPDCHFCQTLAESLGEAPGGDRRQADPAATRRGASEASTGERPIAKLRHLAIDHRRATTFLAGRDNLEAGPVEVAKGFGRHCVHPEKMATGTSFDKPPAGLSGGTQLALAPPVA